VQVDPNGISFEENCFPSSILTVLFPAAFDFLGTARASFYFSSSATFY
jgi:hypothetical protein